MNRESLVFAASGIFFGLLVGWVLGSQQASIRPPAPAAAPAAASGQSASTPPPPALDQARASSLEVRAASAPADAPVRVELGNLYFDAERYSEAIRWYEDALEIDPRNVNASTDLGVCYYYTNQPDRALKQFDISLAVDPNHTKTILNQGIVRAFGKQDLEGAAKSWQRVIELAPASQEARAAQQALDAMKGAHPDVAPGAPAAPKGR